MHRTDAFPDVHEISTGKSLFKRDIFSARTMEGSLGRDTNA